MKERAGIQSVEVGFGLLEALSLAPGPADAARPGGRGRHERGQGPSLPGELPAPAAGGAGRGQHALRPRARRRSSSGWPRCRGWTPSSWRASASAPLVEQIGHTLALAVWGNHGPTIVHWEESPQAVTVNLRLGDVMPLLSSATGRCFAAFLSREAITPLLKDEIALAQKQGRADVPASLAAGARPARRSAPARRGAGGRHPAARHRRVLRAGVRLGRPHGAGPGRARAQPAPSTPSGTARWTGPCARQRGNCRAIWAIRGEHRRRHAPAVAAGPEAGGAGRPPVVAARGAGAGAVAPTAGVRQPSSRAAIADRARRLPQPRRRTAAGRMPRAEPSRCAVEAAARRRRSGAAPEREPAVRPGGRPAASRRQLPASAAASGSVCRSAAARQPLRGSASRPRCGCTTR